MGIYKRKQDSKKRRKHAFDQEGDQEKKKKERKHALHQESDQEKRKNDNGQEKKKENTLSIMKKTKNYNLQLMSQIA